MDHADTLVHIAESHASTQPEHFEKLKSDYLRQIQRFGVKPGQINSRYVETQKFNSADFNLESRTDFFHTRAQEIFEKIYPINSGSPDHLIHVTCTGYVSPSSAQTLVLKNNWEAKTRVTHAYHMGCYASLPAVRMADAFVKAEDQQVDIVHTEMCALHMDRYTHTPEQFVVQSLFADGHMKYSLSHQASTKSLRVLTVQERLLKDTEQDMTWRPSHWGMTMTLSRDVPKKIGGEVVGFLEMLAIAAGLDYHKMMQDSLFAIHPGGPRIIDLLVETLKLKEEQVEMSRLVLSERGNMSSATLPHVWEKILEKKYSPSRPVISLAFGPGLTIFGAVFEIV